MTSLKDGYQRLTPSVESKKNFDVSSMPQIRLWSQSKI
jgi:hypothetical protein